MTDDTPVTRRSLRPAKAAKRASRAPVSAPAAPPAPPTGAPRSGLPVRAPRPRAQRRGPAANLLSLGALTAAAALLVAMSVPANAFMGDASAVADPDPIERGPGQSLKVSEDAVSASVGERDDYEVLSYAQVLALKYAGVDYSYEATSGDVRWPFPYSVPINDGFGPRSDGFHKGIDMMAASGTPIYAIADGVASTATFDDSGYGQHIVLTSNLGGVNIDSVYAHMIADSSPIKQGQEVKVGDFLGLVGDTGYTTAVHLHFEIHIDGVPVDPFAWLEANAE